MTELNRRPFQELNSQTIHQSMKRLLSGNPIIENGVLIDLPISLVEGSFTLAYLMERFCESVALPFRVETYIVDLSKDISIATREYNFYPGKRNSVIIHSYSETEVDHQSRGYGMGLFRCTSIIIEDVIKRVPELRGRSLVSEISDAAEGKGIRDDQSLITREGWSSQQAKALGYKRVDQYHWRKKF